MKFFRDKHITTRHAARILTVAFFVSACSLYSNDLNASKENGESRDKWVTVDLQVTPNKDVRSADVTISITNLGKVNVTPQGIRVLHSEEAGDFYLSSARQSIDKLRPFLNLSQMGTIAPKAVARMKATISGVTNGEDDFSKEGDELEFHVQVRFADGTAQRFKIVRLVKR